VDNKKVSADLNIELNIECPSCDECINMFELNGMNDEGELYTASISEEAFTSHHEEFNFDVECPNCEALFNVNELNW